MGLASVQTIWNGGSGLWASCATCGKPLTVYKRDHRFCSATCRRQGFTEKRMAEVAGALEHLERVRTWLISEYTRLSGKAPRSRGTQKAS